MRLLESDFNSFSGAKVKQGEFAYSLKNNPFQCESLLTKTGHPAQRGIL
jgi:hypothetical protein